MPDDAEPEVPEPETSTTDQDAADADGRTLRRTRNRQQVISALIEIVQSGEMDPSVADIADRAGVSHRSVFRYFDDINDLVTTAVGYQLQETAGLARLNGLGEGSFDRRLDSWVDTRIQLYKATYWVGRVARRRATDVPAIDEGIQQIYHGVARQMKTHFAIELAKLGSDDALIVDAMMTLTSFESYDLHRRIFDHGTERIRQTWLCAMRRMLVGSA